MMGNQLNVMTQAPYPEDKADLPNGLCVMRMYMELKDGSRNVSLVLQNLTTWPIYLVRGWLIGQVAVANAVLEAQCSPELLKQLEDEGEDKPEPAKLLMQQRQELLLAALKKDGGLDRLKEWLPKLAKKVVALLLEFHHVFSLEPNEIGCTDATKHVIELMKDEPFKERFHRITPPLVDEVRQDIQEMLDGGAIRLSQTPWCNAVVLVRKKDGLLRFCIDFRRLNARTKKDAYPLPRMQETMESMVGAQHFSCMDLKSGFWQIKMDEESRQYTTFTVGSMGVYKFLHMPYGLCNAPATFQHLMQNCLGELNLTYALIYLDDMIVYSKTEGEHLVRLHAILERFMENGLKLKPSKCNFFHTEINYLGHKVSVDRMEPGTEGLKGITEIAPPAMYTQVRKFLGTTGYFCHFIKGYARITKPLNDLLQGENSKLKSHPVGLLPDALAAFQELKMKFLTAPVLAFADFKKPFLLETNASIEGLGAVLSQEQEDGRYHLVAYTSHGLKGGKLKYHSSKLEFLALKWAMTKQFREYLQYQPFLVKTDNNPLTYVFTTPNLDAVGHRWVAAMAGYNFEIQYVCGLDNKVANALSHIGGHLDEDDIKELLDQSAIKELLSHAVRYGVPQAESDDPRVTQEHEKVEGEIIMQARMLVEMKRNYQNLADSQWVVAQRGDQAIRLIMDWLRRRKDDNHTLDQYLKHHVPHAERHIYAAHQKDFLLRRNILYLRVMPKRSNEDVLAFVVPGLKRQAGIDGCHRYLGHQGRDRTLSLLGERFWWPGMAQRMMMSIRNCPKCCIFEAKPQIPPMEPILCTEPLDLVHIDYVSMEVTVGIKEKPIVKNVLVIKDHFTRYTQAYVTNNHTACTTARVLYNEFFSVFGFPRQLMSDQAAEFTGQVISELCDLLGVTKIKMSPYHPQTNGTIKRVHQTLRRMIAKMDANKRAKWPSHLGPILIAYNATRSLITGYSPYFPMFGHRPRLPVDLLFPTVRRDENSWTTDEYVTSL